MGHNDSDNGITRARITNPKMDHRVDDDDRKKCIDDGDNLQPITSWFKVVTSDKRWYLPSGVPVLGYDDGVRVEGEGRGSVSGLLSVSLLVSSSVWLVLLDSSYHNESAAENLWKIHKFFLGTW